jgi:hypothetical protein
VWADGESRRSTGGVRGDGTTTDGVDEDVGDDRWK